jgi:hypothetical protein
MAHENIFKLCLLNLSYLLNIYLIMVFLFAIFNLTEQDLPSFRSTWVNLGIFVGFVLLNRPWLGISSKPRKSTRRQTEIWTIIRGCTTYYPALVLFEQANCIDWINIRSILSTFSGTPSMCYLLSFGNLTVNPVHFMLTENIKRDPLSNVFMQNRCLEKRGNLKL